jgi:radical SAM protein with 4Fe4S-binding SPASM domain
VKVRYEVWGAWVRTENPPALVALDRSGALALGLDGKDTWLLESAPSAPLEVHVAVTSRCGVGCEGCYLDATPSGAHVPLRDLLSTIDAIADAGVFTIALGGGEPILRDDLDILARHAKSRGLTCVLTTSGVGLTREKARTLRELAQINVSYDGVGETYSAVRGTNAAKQAEKAIEMLIFGGNVVGVNIVLTRVSFAHLEETLDRAQELGAVEAQLLRYKPAGRAARIDYLDKRLTAEQACALAPFLRSYVARPSRLRVRIDCALVPFLSADRELDPARLVRLGVLGCEAGAKLAAVRSDGRIAPCSFAAASETTDFSGAASDTAIARFRDYVAAEPCASCALKVACRGGCKVVTGFLHPETNGFAPDPECPRVRGLA